MKINSQTAVTISLEDAETTNPASDPSGDPSGDP